MRIGIVNNLPSEVSVLRQTLALVGRHQIVWVAMTGAEAVRYCADDGPDLVLMDIALPDFSGVEATRQIMAHSPCPILIVTATVSGSTSKVFEALGAGAVDAINTPEIGAKLNESSAALLKKIEMMEKLIFGSNREKLTRALPRPRETNQEQLVAIGASAGGPVALAELLGSLPKNFPAAVIIVQHVDSQFAQGLSDWLGTHSAMPVRLAKEGERPVKGTVLIAGKNDHLTFLNAHTVGYTPNPVNYVYRPSVDVFFESVVKHWKGKTVGVLLTGMGRDGAQGLKMLRDAGCHTIVQDSATCLVYGMPKAAVALDAADEILPLSQIGLTLKRLHVNSDQRPPS